MFYYEYFPFTCSLVSCCASRSIRTRCGFELRPPRRSSAPERFVSWRRHRNVDRGLVGYFFGRFIGGVRGRSRSSRSRPFLQHATNGAPRRVLLPFGHLFRRPLGYRKGVPPDAIADWLPTISSKVRCQWAFVSGKGEKECRSSLPTLGIRVELFSSLECEFLPLNRCPGVRQGRGQSELDGAQQNGRDYRLSSRRGDLFFATYQRRRRWV